MVCELDRAVGELNACPGESCPFWVDARCVLAGLRSDWSPSLARLLRDVRGQLSLPGGRELVPPGLRD